MSTEKQLFPDWWPENPYPEDIFPMTTDEYIAAIPDEDTRTAISGCLGRVFWNTASLAILEAYISARVDALDEFQSRVDAMILSIKENL